MKKGFTLLELIIVIAIIAILATILLIVINPVEIIRRARDTERTADLAALKLAIGIYLTEANVANSNSALDSSGNDTCFGESSPTVYYSKENSDMVGKTFGLIAAIRGAPGEPGQIDGNGWIPIDLGSLAQTSPISHLPVDPVNSIAGTIIKNTDLVYRYACKTNPISFEIDARLESQKYINEDKLMEQDGGDNSFLYEIGTNLRILDDSSFEY